MALIKEKLKKNIKLILFIALLAAAFCNNHFLLTDLKEKYDGKIKREDVTMPPTLSLITVALGPIRGLIVDALWWKVSELEESSEYFEIIRITDWITLLQPNNSFVWTYHSWNLAYNIAYEFPTPETRWKWVYSGIKLLRDEGLKYNPGDDFIKSELAVLFLDRIGGYSDPSRIYFVKKWAEIVGKYLPKGKRNNIKDLAFPKDNTEKKLAFELKNKLNLDPERMLKIDKLYGPFQWKLTQAQAVYWGVKGNFSDYTQGYLNYKSNVFSALKKAFVMGGLVEDRKNGLFVITNNLDMTQGIINYLEKDISLSKNPEKAKIKYREFIKNAAPILYDFERISAARKFFEVYKNITPSDKNLKFKYFIDINRKRMLKKAPSRYQQSIVEISLFKGYDYMAEGVGFDELSKWADYAEKRWRNYQIKFRANKTMQMQSFEDIKCAAFVKLLQKYPAERRKKLIELAHNKGAGKMRIEPKYNFEKYVSE